MDYFGLNMADAVFYQIQCNFKKDDFITQICANRNKAYFLTNNGNCMAKSFDKFPANNVPLWIKMIKLIEWRDWNKRRNFELLL